MNTDERAPTRLFEDLPSAVAASAPTKTTAELTSRRTIPMVAAVVVLALGYFLSAKVGLMLSHGWIASPVWPPAGVAVAGLLLFGRRAWPGVALGSFLIGLPQGVMTDVGTVLAQTLGPLAAVTVLEARPFNKSLDRVADVLRLLIVGGAGMCLSASVATAVLAGTGVVGEGEWIRVWATWWLGDAMGVILVAPLILSLASPTPVGRRWREAAALLVATAICTRVLFIGDLPLVFLVFPFALWAALRLGPPVAAAVSTLVSGIAIWTTAQGHGAFSTLPDTSSLVVLEAFNAGVAITSLVLAAAVATTVRLTSENVQLHAEVRAQLDEVLASRARIVQAAYGERRRMERDLHDGAQQRLVSLTYILGLAVSRLTPDGGRQLQASLIRARDEGKAALSELRALAQGIHPALLTQEGLGAALESLAELATLPVDVHAPAGRYPPVVEATAYFVVSEALANVAKHAHAAVAKVSIEEVDGRLLVEVADDGIGGADPARGSGLTGLVDRVAALKGSVGVDSPLGGGTRVRAELPCDWS